MSGKMKFDIPEPLQIADAELRAHLAAATAAGGKTGEAARALTAVLLPHLTTERQDVFQPLALLGALAEGEAAPGMADVLPIIDRLKAERPRLQAEHNAIFAALKGLVAAAKSEGKTDSARFGERLIVRIWIDEAVFYPAAILVGEYLKLKLRK